MPIGAVGRMISAVNLDRLAAVMGGCPGRGHRSRPAGPAAPSCATATMAAGISSSTSPLRPPRAGWTDPVAALVGRAGHLHVMGTALTMPAAAVVIARAVEVVKARRHAGRSQPAQGAGRPMPRPRRCSRRSWRGADLLLPSGAERSGGGHRRRGGGGRTPVRHGRGRGRAEAWRRGATGSHARGPGRWVAEIDPDRGGRLLGGAYVTALRQGGRRP